MNQQIKQFIQKSGLIMHRTKDIYNWEYAVEEFVKLIVQECANIADEFADEQLQTRPSDQMKHCFGVKK
jgi:hypothetical protein